MENNFDSYELQGQNIFPSRNENPMDIYHSRMLACYACLLVTLSYHTQGFEMAQSSDSSVKTSVTRSVILSS